MGEDQVQLRNGDRYVGHVLSFTTNHIQFTNPILGEIRLPRSQVASVQFGVTPSVSPLTNLAPAIQPTNASPESSDLAAQIGSASGLIKIIESQFLNGAGPEAKQKFQELLRGLSTGKLTLSDLRAEARAAADQLRAVKQELGDEAGFAIDGYLAILDKFLKDPGAEAPAKPGAK